MRPLLGIVFALVMIWAIGFFLFMRAVPQASDAAVAKADGAVVYTGLGGARVTTGMTVLARGDVERLLISGVNPGTTRELLAEMWPGDRQAFECCVDLGLEAKTTEGNAREVRDWAREHGFTSLVLVTSDYHMRRALLETRTQLPEATIIPHPVESGYLDEKRRPASAEAWRQLAFEYSKFLAVRAKILISAG
ncbi:MAG: YdcF family protein [Parvularculaceae bacterium]